MFIVRFQSYNLSLNVVFLFQSFMENLDFAVITKK